MSMKAVIKKKLTLALQPTALEVVDESDQHRGHGGWRPGGETHFRVYVTSELFRGQTRLERHRKINDVLSEELASSVHALAIHADVPAERTTAS